MKILITLSLVLGALGSMQAFCDDSASAVNANAPVVNEFAQEPPRCVNPNRTPASISIDTVPDPALVIGL